MTDIDLCTSGDCLSAPFSLWVALDILFVLIAAVLVVYGEVIKIPDMFINLTQFTVCVRLPCLAKPWHSVGLQLIH